MYLLIYIKNKDYYPIHRTFNSMEEMNGYIRALKEFYREYFKIIKNYKIEKEID